MIKICTTLAVALEWLLLDLINEIHYQLNKQRTINLGHFFLPNLLIKISTFLSAYKNRRTVFQEKVKIYPLRLLTIFNSLVYTSLDFLNMYMEEEHTERKKESSHTLIHSPDAHNSQDSARSRQGDWNSVWVLWVTGTNDKSHLYFPGSVLAENWSQELELDIKSRLSCSGMGPSQVSS